MQPATAHSKPHRRPVRARLLSVCLVAAVTAALIGVHAGTASAAPNAGNPMTARTSSQAVDNCPRVTGRKVCLSERIPLHRSAAISHSVESDLAAESDGYRPADLASAYQLPSSTSTATVAIVDAYDAPSVESDLAYYRASYGLPACTTANGRFSKMNQNGQPEPLPPADDDWAGETTLDVEMVSAVCPTCHILLLESNDDDRSGKNNMESAVKTATTLGARYVSMSWGGDENSTETALDRRYLNVPGVTDVAASGDDDYGTTWPAVNPAVVSVGGTTLLRSGAERGWTESVWGEEQGSGTGSGCSSYERKPLWQNAIAAPLWHSTTATATRPRAVPSPADGCWVLGRPF